MVDCQRIATDTTPTKVGAAQIKELKRTARMEVLITADSEYLTEVVLDEADARTHLLIRMKGNRKLFGRPAERRPGQRGAPAVHGPKLKLNQADDLPTPDVRVQVVEDDGSWVVISVWKNRHVATRPKLDLCAVRIELFKANGQRRFKRPLWLAWTGSPDQDWTTFWRIYLKRFSIEAVHQFTKNSLSWTRARLGETTREERWSWLVMLAYWQLILAAPVARDRCRPWEKPTPEGKLPTPGRVQRDFGRILLVVGTPARIPKVRGIPPGRPFGLRPKPRPRFEIIVKAKKKAKKAKKVKTAA
ncbi:MAG: hypothetical protein K1Y36_04530 [Blastocatellia bacterium]|nr:hypothetical protein [Blastocatellia bacterium]